MLIYYVSGVYLPPKGFVQKKLASYGNIEIFEDFPFNTYVVSQQKLPPLEQSIADAFIQLISRKASFKELENALGNKKGFIEEIRQKIVQPIDAGEMTLRIPSLELSQKILDSIVEIAKKINCGNPGLFAQIVADETIGMKSLSVLMRDSSLEEIMANGFEKNIFVFHKQFGFCRTSILASEKGFLREIISKIAATASRAFNEQNPLLDARLPDGSRANATMQYVTPQGHSLTIRKFNRVPLSIISLIENNTVSSEIAAFLWAMVEGINIEPKNIIVTGGTGTGKTTLLNVLSFFVRQQERVITIEDTVELDLAARENWIQMEARPRFRDIEAVSMDDLLKNSLRMRPDRLIVGEVRGEEAQTLFVAMDTGHQGILGTLHSNNAREMLLRLKTPPMNVPEQMLPLLDIVVVMQRRYDRENGMMRRIKQISEVSRMDEKVLLSTIFEHNEKKDSIEKTDVPSHVFEVLAQRAGLSKNELKREILVRQKILDWMLAEGIKEVNDVSQIIQTYYAKPEAILKQVSQNL